MRRIRKGDEVIVLAGKDKGKRGHVLRVVDDERVVGMVAREDVMQALRRALPVRFKTSDFNARASEVGVEELHLVHEGLEHAEAA